MSQLKKLLSQLIYFKCSKTEFEVLKKLMQLEFNMFSFIQILSCMNLSHGHEFETCASYRVSVIPVKIELQNRNKNV